MNLTDEQLQRYWNDNPEALAQAVASNPAAFGMGGQDVNVGVPGLATQRMGGEQPNSFVDNLLALNQSYADNRTIQSQVAAMPPAFDITSWLAEDPSRTPQQALEQGLLSLGGMTNVPGQSQFGDFSKYQAEQRSGYADQLDQLLADTGRSRVENRDGKLYALYTGFEGPDTRFKALDSVPIGYEWTEGNRNVGEWYRVKEPSKDFGDYAGQLVKSSLGIAGALTGNPWVAGLTAGAQTGFQGGDFEDVLKSGLIAAAPIAISDFLTPAASVAGADGLSNVVTNTASGAARTAAPNLARETSGFLSNLSASAQSATQSIADALSSVSRLPITPDDVAAALTSGTMAGLRGGDLEDALKAAAAAGLTSPITKALGAQLGIDTEGEIEVPNIFREGTTGVNKDDLLAALGAGVGALAGGDGLDEAAQDALLKYIREGGSFGFLKPGEFDLPEFDLPDFNFGETPEWLKDIFPLGETPEWLKDIFPLGETPEWIKNIESPFPLGETPEWIKNIESPFPLGETPEWLKDIFPLGETPDFDVDLPDLNLPEFNLPDLNLPEIDLPDIDLSGLLGLLGGGLGQVGGMGVVGTESADFEPSEITPFDLAGALDLFMQAAGTRDYNVDDIVNLLDNRTA